MIRLLILCEGKTESFFIKEVLSPHLATRDILTSPKIVETKRGKHRGGVSSYSKIRNDATRLLAHDKNTFLSTLFDLYALPNDFPEFEETLTRSDPFSRVKLLEGAFADDLNRDLRFMPHLQLHEFEGLLFSDVEKLQQVVDPDGDRKSIDRLQSVLEAAGSPELIDDGHQTAPSKRIASVYPGYNKAAHGPLIAARIGLDKIRSVCPHFDRWVARLENLSR